MHLWVVGVRQLQLGRPCWIMLGGCVPDNGEGWSTLVRYTSEREEREEIYKYERKRE